MVLEIYPNANDKKIKGINVKEEAAKLLFADDLIIYMEFIINKEPSIYLTFTNRLSFTNKEAPGGYIRPRLFRSKPQRLNLSPRGKHENIQCGIVKGRAGKLHPAELQPCLRPLCPALRIGDTKMAATGSNGESGEGTITTRGENSVTGLTWQAIRAQKKLGLSGVGFPGVTPPLRLGEEK